MKTVKSVRQSVLVNEWAVSIDLTDAYLHVPIHPHSRKYLRFMFENQVYQSSHYGWGAHLKPMRLSFHGRWKEDQSQLHINIPEIMAIHFGLKKAIQYRLELFFSVEGLSIEENSTLSKG